MNDIANHPAVQRLRRRDGSLAARPCVRLQERSPHFVDGTSRLPMLDEIPEAT